MVIYDLICQFEHEFEGWFKNSEDFESQVRAELVECPFCGTHKVARKPSAVKIGSKATKAASESQPAEAQQKSEQNEPGSQQVVKYRSKIEMAQLVRHFVESNFEDVGPRFSDEARKIHYGEAEQRNIRGSATEDQVKELAEEGIESFAVPGLADDKGRLN